jgi:hypothetical protein
MPKTLELKLKKEAIKKFGKNSPRVNKYVYGTMNRLHLLKRK